MSRKYETLDEECPGPGHDKLKDTIALLKQKKASRRKKLVKTLLVSLIVVLLAAITVLLVLFLAPNWERASQYYKDRFIDSISAEMIKQETSAFASHPHLAGTPADYQTALDTKAKWTSYGIKTRIEETKVLLTYPKTREVFATFTDGSSFKCSLKEDVIPEDRTSGDPDIVPTWLGWSAPGNVTGDLVYVNYGREEDFNLIPDLNLTGKIVIVRFGKIFRGNKVSLAAARGAIGVLIYSDPEDTGYLRGEPYPKGPWGTNSTVQRGSIWTGNGDPQTPGWPSVDEGPRLSIEDAIDQKNSPWAPLPKIPVQPLSSRDAEPLLRALQGSPVPNSDWGGAFGLKFIGPGPVTVRVTIDVEYKTTPIWNVIGQIRGEVETDRQVIIGSHRDAWVFGAGDPVSGHSCLMEIARGFGTLLSKGWTPRRTVVFASWDAEEYGLIGSVEWAEKWSAVLTHQAVAYLNLDATVRGFSSIDVSGTPSLTKLFADVSKLVKYNDTTIYDMWTTKKMDLLAAGSDNAVFAQHLGIPTLYVDAADPIGEAVYHSAYDSVYWMENFGDPTFEAHAAMTKLYGLIAMNLIDNLVLPFDYTDYAAMMSEAVQHYEALAVGHVDFGLLHQSLQVFNDSARALASELKGFNTFVANAMKCERVAYQVESLNSRMFTAERSFLADSTLSGHGWYRHVVSSPSDTNQYGGVPFPAIGNAIEKQDWEKTQFLVARIAIMINATSEYFSQAFFTSEMQPIT